MPTLEQATSARLQEIRDLAESGYSELTGRARREYYRTPQDVGRVVGRFGGLNIKELQSVGVSHQQAAQAIRRGKGKVFARIETSVRREMEREGFKPARKRSTGPLLDVAPHAGRRYCAHCRTFHAKGQHRFHGEGSFHRTHLFAFGDNVPNVAEAKRVFAQLMQIARERKLSQAERQALQRASQVIRYSHRRTAAHNPAKKLTFQHLPPGGVFEFVGEKMPRGPWRKTGNSHFALAYGPKTEYAVKPSAPVRVSERGLFAGGPLFTNRRLRRKKPVRKTSTRSKFQHERLRSPKKLYHLRTVTVGKHRVIVGCPVKHAGRCPVPMVAQAILHPPKENPAGRGVRMGKLVELRYERDFGKKPGFYKHQFRRRPPIYYNRSADRISIG